jgi:hypothetical protein
MEIIDTHRPRFGRIRWALVRALLTVLNRLDLRLAKVREWAIQEAVDSSPDFDTFETWVVKHFAERGMKANVTVEAANVPPVQPPEPTHLLDTQYLQ